MEDLCPRQLIDLDVSNFEYWIFVDVFCRQTQWKNQNKYSKFDMSWNFCEKLWRKNSWLLAIFAYQSSKILIKTVNLEIFSNLKFQQTGYKYNTEIAHYCSCCPVTSSVRGTFNNYVDEKGEGVTTMSSHGHVKKGRCHVKCPQLSTLGGVGGQNRVKFGPPSCWMTPSLLCDRPAVILTHWVQWPNEPLYKFYSGHLFWWPVDRTSPDVVETNANCQKTYFTKWYNYWILSFGSWKSCGEVSTVSHLFRRAWIYQGWRKRKRKLVQTQFWHLKSFLMKSYSKCLTT